MYDELDTLQTEFGEFECDLKQHTISIVTDPIALEDIDLGSFRIVLHWDRLNQPRAYDVIALEPYAATSHDDVTHPHVQGRSLCEGDSIRVAARATVRLLPARDSDLADVQRRQCLRPTRTVDGRLLLRLRRYGQRR